MSSGFKIRSGFKRVPAGAPGGQDPGGGGPSAPTAGISILNYPSIVVAGNIFTGHADVQWVNNGAGAIVTSYRWWKESPSGVLTPLDAAGVYEVTYNPSSGEKVIFEWLATDAVGNRYSARTIFNVGVIDPPGGGDGGTGGTLATFDREDVTMDSVAYSFDSDSAGISFDSEVITFDNNVISFDQN